MTTEEKILLEILHRERAIASTEPPPHWHIGRNDFLVEQEHGPRWCSTEWFKDSSPAGRQRHSRALRKLVAAGLIEPWARWEGRTTHIRLTAAGRAAAERLETAR